MLHFVNTLFNIHTDEWPRVLYLYITYLILGVGATWAATIIEAAFLTQVGLEFLPLAVMMQALLTIFIIGIYTVFVDHVAIYRMMILILWLSASSNAIAIIILIAGFEHIAYPMLFLLYPVTISLFALQWWNYFDEFYDTLTAKRVVPVVASALLVGTILGGLSLRLVNTVLSPAGVITIWMLILLIMVALVYYFPRFFKDNIDTEQGRTHLSGSYFDSLREGSGYIIEIPFLRWTAISGFLLIIFMELIRYESSWILLKNLDTTEALSNFTSTLIGLINLVVLPTQLFLFSRIVRKLGVENTNLIFPSLSLLVVGMMIVSPPLVIIGALGIFDRSGLRNAFQSPIEILMFNTVSMRIKGRTGAVIAGVIQPLGAFLAGGMLLFILPLLKHKIAMAVMLGGIAIAYTWVSWILKKEYTASLLRTLQEEDISFLLDTSSDMSLVDPTMLNWLIDRLNESTDYRQTIFLVDVISQVGGPDTAEILGNLARHEDVRVRRSIADLLIASGWHTNEVLAIFHLMLDDPDSDVRRSALLGCKTINDESLNDMAMKLQDDPVFDVHIEALAILVESSDQEIFRNMTTRINVLLYSDNVKERLAGVRLLKARDNQIRLLKMADDKDEEVRLHAMLALEDLARKSVSSSIYLPLMKKLPTLLNNPVERIRQATVAIVGHMDTGEAYQQALPALLDASPEVRDTAVASLVKAREDVITELETWMQSKEPQKRDIAVIALCHLRPDTYESFIPALAEEYLKAISHNEGYLAALSPHTEQYISAAILRDVMQEKNQQYKEQLFFALSSAYGRKVIQVIAHTLEQESTRPNALEALESLTNPQFAEHMGMLFDENRTHQQFYSLYHTAPLPTIEAVMTQTFENTTQGWLRGIAIYFVGQSENVFSPETKETLLQTAYRDADNDVRYAARNTRTQYNEAETQLEDNLMLSTIEKVIFLKQVSLFEALPVRLLQILAGISREARYEKDETIFKQGDVGDSMYIIISGEVGVDYESSEGEIIRVAIRGSMDAFGEMALFDLQPRSASIIALKDTLVLHMDGEHLTHLARQHPDLPLALIRVLSQRLRESSQRISELENLE